MEECRSEGAAASRIGDQLARERAELLDKGMDFPTYDEAVGTAYRIRTRDNIQEGCLLMPCIGKASQYYGRLVEQDIPYEEEEVLGIACMAYRKDSSGNYITHETLWIPENNSALIERGGEKHEFNRLPGRTLATIAGHAKVAPKMKVLSLRTTPLAMPKPVSKDDRKLEKWMADRNIRVVPVQKTSGFDFHLVRREIISPLKFWKSPRTTTYVTPASSDLDWSAVWRGAASAKAYATDMPLAEVPPLPAALGSLPAPAPVVATPPPKTPTDISF